MPPNGPADLGLLFFSLEVDLSGDCWDTRGDRAIREGIFRRICDALLEDICHDWENSCPEALYRMLAENRHEGQTSDGDILRSRGYSLLVTRSVEWSLSPTASLRSKRSLAWMVINDL